MLRLETGVAKLRGRAMLRQRGGMGVDSVVFEQADYIRIKISQHSDWCSRFRIGIDHGDDGVESNVI